MFSQFVFVLKIKIQQAFPPLVHMRFRVQVFFGYIFWFFGYFLGFMCVDVAKTASITRMRFMPKLQSVFFGYCFGFAVVGHADRAIERRPLGLYGFADLHL